MKQELNKIDRAVVYSKVFNILWAQNVLEADVSVDSNAKNDRVEDLKEHLDDATVHVERDGTQ
jgi:hypothetical protein